MNVHGKSRLTLIPCLAALALGARAQQLPNPYGENIGVDLAKKAAAAAVTEAKKNGWNVAVAVADTHGSLVYFERMDGTQYGSTLVAQEKARSAAQFKRPTKAFEEGVKGQGINQLGLPGAVPLEGGVPILVSGKIIGAIGVSGGTSAQDGQCATVGANAIAPQGPQAARPAKP
ncbi:MAG TPA: heme-binding protein [Anaeromyxobacteraceae bacterium]|jgi:uncharacterized protein GlcG (DUF336 family)|nr:heme-binding protein [Anaeromyxobacteraceae bacterium]